MKTIGDYIDQNTHSITIFLCSFMEQIHKNGISLDEAGRVAMNSCLVAMFSTLRIQSLEKGEDINFDLIRQEFERLFDVLIKVKPKTFN